MGWIKSRGKTKIQFLLNTKCCLTPNGKIKRSKHKAVTKRYFYILCPNGAGFKKNCFESTEQGPFKEENMEERVF